MILDIGYRNARFDVRKEYLSVGLREPLSIAFLSDLHFTSYSEDICQKLISQLSVLKADIILFGGDYLDTKKGRGYLEALFKKACSICDHVFAIAGNHDYFFGLKALKNITSIYDIEWLEQSSGYIKLNGDRIVISNAIDQLKKTNADLRIICTHIPPNPKKVSHQYDLSLSGHLHGCQFVFWKRNDALYPGKYFYHRNVLKQKIDQHLYIVSKGLGDTLPIRVNCRKELVMVHID